jgi:NAD(P)-dependent dehydrogenase (short-subunit alcohol dehydrogenase family)
MHTSLKGKTALVTGGTSGIGAATVLALADAGANVVFTGRRRPEGDALVAKAAGKPGKVRFVQGDVTDEAHLADAVNAAKSLGGRLDLAFNNAGVELIGVPVAELTAEAYHKVFNINVLGVALSMKHQIRAMLSDTKGGSIVNTASIAASVGMATGGVYIASKHAVLGFTRTAALEVAKEKIRVNTVSPGAIETEMYDRFAKDDQTRSYMASLHPIGRVGTSQEVTDAVLFLLSDEASFITGHDLRVDGGFTVP